ncbi:MAG: hypothetical protein WD509_02340 [Candidatus Paceibacterota bacterium]
MSEVVNAFAKSGEYEFKTSGDFLNRFLRHGHLIVQDNTRTVIHDDLKLPSQALSLCVVTGIKVDQRIMLQDGCFGIVDLSCIHAQRIELQGASIGTLVLNNLQVVADGGIGRVLTEGAHIGKIYCRDTALAQALARAHPHTPIFSELFWMDYRDYVR